jgi:hypothetical protein
VYFVGVLGEKFPKRVDERSMIRQKR